MIIRNNISSRFFNTFNVDVSVDTYIQIDQDEDYFALESIKDKPLRILGGGSNILLTKDISDPVVSINTNGIEIIIESEDHALVSVASGETWHDVVLWAIKNDLGGIENLSLIPGKCGAAPIQNIGAYGVELKDVLHSLKAYHIQSGIEHIFHHQECAFAYRNSHFKGQWKGQYIISEIILKLTKPGFHKLNISYGAISSELEKRHITEPTIKDISDVVIAIRQSKLPDPKVVGNAGSFFKNPIISSDIFDGLKSEFPQIPHYPSGENIKLAAGWLIDQCGWKGKVVGDTGTYKNQALVLVNRGQASGSEILSVAKAIQNDVDQKFGINLHPEVNIW